MLGRPSRREGVIDSNCSSLIHLWPWDGGCKGVYRVLLSNLLFVLGWREVFRVGIYSKGKLEVITDVIKGAYSRRLRILSG